jgi:aspartate-semialdehyde dehydrogenase
VLTERDFPYSDIRMLASARSAGRTYDFEGQTYTVKELTEGSFADCDIALFSAGGGISKKFGPIASDAGCTVVDNSSAFRMTEGVPLVIPEVNADAMAGMKVRPAALLSPYALQQGRINTVISHCVAHAPSATAL